MNKIFCVCSLKKKSGFKNSFSIFSGMTTVVVSDAIMQALTSNGYQRVTLENCQLLNNKYQLGKNMQFYIDRQQQLQEVEVWRVKNASNAEVVYYSVNGVLGDKAPVTVADNGSLCTFFRDLISPNSKNFQDYLTLWTRGGGLFGGPLLAALVYHCPAERTVSGANEKEVAPAAANRTRPLRGGIAILTVAGIVWYLWKKNRDRKRKEQENLAQSVALLNAAAEANDFKNE